MTSSCWHRTDAKALPEPVVTQLNGTLHLRETSTHAQYTVYISKLRDILRELVGHFVQCIQINDNAIKTVYNAVVSRVTADGLVEWELGHLQAQGCSSSDITYELHWQIGAVDILANALYWNMMGTESPRQRWHVANLNWVTDI